MNTHTQMKAISRAINVPPRIAINVGVSRSSNIGRPLESSDVVSMKNRAIVTLILTHASLDPQPLAQTEMH